MDKPTKEQIQWFWEQCGLTFLKDRDGTLTWYDSEENFVDFGYPDIDLNNLFKYAVPKLGDKEWYEITFGNALTTSKLYAVRVTAWKCKGRTFHGRGDDPALALFWAIYKALGGQ